MDNIIVDCFFDSQCICVRARYMDKSNGDGVETENSFTLGVTGVAVYGPDEATSGLAKLLPVERQPLPV